MYRIMGALVNDVMPALRRIVYADDRIAELRSRNSADFGL